MAASRPLSLSCAADAPPSRPSGSGPRPKSVKRPSLMQNGLTAPVDAQGHDSRQMLLRPLCRKSFPSAASWRISALPGSLSRTRRQAPDAGNAAVFGRSSLTHLSHAAESSLPWAPCLRPMERGFSGVMFLRSKSSQPFMPPTMPRHCTSRSGSIPIGAWISATTFHSALHSAPWTRSSTALRLCRLATANPRRPPGKSPCSRCRSIHEGKLVRLSPRPPQATAFVVRLSALPHMDGHREHGDQPPVRDGSSPPASLVGASPFRSIPRLRSITCGEPSILSPFLLRLRRMSQASTGPSAS